MNQTMTKYHAVRTFYDGKWFGSKRESERYKDLVLMERAKLISDLKTQVKFELIPKCGKERPAYYIADFTYSEPQNGGLEPRHIVEDSKGRRTKDYIIKRKLMLYVHGIEIRET